MTFVYLLDQFMSVILLIILKFSEASINKILLVSDLRKIFCSKTVQGRFKRFSDFSVVAQIARQIFYNESYRYKFIIYYSNK